MKKLTYLITAPLLALMLFVTSCASFQPSSQDVQIAVSTAVVLGLKYGIKDAAKRANVANYVNVYAGALRSITGTPTPEELTAQINSFIPENVKTQFPEITAFVVPLVVSRYQTEYAKLKGNAKATADWFNTVATALEQGSAAFVTKK